MSLYMLAVELRAMLSTSSCVTSAGAALPAVIDSRMDAREAKRAASASSALPEPPREAVLTVLRTSSTSEGGGRGHLGAGPPFELADGALNAAPEVAGHGSRPP